MSSSTLHAMFFTKIVLVPPPTPLACGFFRVLICNNIISITETNHCHNSGKNHHCCKQFQLDSISPWVGGNKPAASHPPCQNLHPRHPQDSPSHFEAGKISYVSMKITLTE